MGGWTGVETDGKLLPPLPAPCVQGLLGASALLLSWEGKEGLVGKSAEEDVGETKLPGDWVRSQVSGSSEQCCRF